MNNHTLVRWVLLLAWVFVFPACSDQTKQRPLAQKELDLVRGGECAYVISIPPNARSSRFAVSEIQRYIKSISGAELPVNEGSTGMKVIALGPLQGSEYQSFDEELGEDGYIVAKAGSRIQLLGASPRAQLYAAYHFLEKYLGCGWTYPGQDVIPKSKNIKLPAVIFDLEKPAFSYRALMLFPYSLNRSLDDIDWMAKNRLNYAHVAVNSSREGPVLGLRLWEKHRSRETFIPELEKRGLSLHFGGHTYFVWVAPEKYFSEHPEYFSLIGGKRVPKSLCISNAEVAKIAAENMAQFVAANPETDIIDFWINDTNDWCECDECKKMESVKRFTIEGGKVDSKSESALKFVNAVAKEFGTKHRNIMVNFLAYARVIDAPIGVKPAPNVQVGYAPIGRAALLNKSNQPGLRSGYYSPLYDVDDRQNRAYLEEMNKWIALTQNFYMYDYYTPWQTLSSSRSKLKTRQMRFLPIVETMGQDIWYYQHLAIDGISTEQFDWPELDMYAYARLVWNPDQSVQGVIEDYCRKSYQSSEAPMLAHWLALNQAKGEWMNRREECLGYVAKARELTSDPTVLSRIDRIADIWKGRSADHPFRSIEPFPFDE